jgi:hypothetical protein
MRLLLPLFCCAFFGTAFIDAQQSPSPTTATLTFVRKFNAAVDGIVGDTYWLQPEGDLARAAAVASPVGK